MEDIKDLDPNSFIPRLRETNVISLISLNSTTYFRFNLRKNSAYLDFDSLDALFKRTSLQSPVFTSSAVFSKITSKIRPLVSNWNQYIDDLLFDGYLIEDSVKRKIKYFRLSN